MTALSKVAIHYQEFLRSIPEKPFTINEVPALLNTVKMKLSLLDNAIKTLSSSQKLYVSSITYTPLQSAPHDRITAFTIEYLNSLSHLDSDKATKDLLRASFFILSPLGAYNQIESLGLEVTPETQLHLPCDTMMFFHECASGVILHREVKIGEGHYGSIWKKRRGDTSIACKTLANSKNSTDVKSNEEALYREYVLYSILKHPNILQCLGFNNAPELYLEFASNYSLAIFLSKLSILPKNFYSIDRKLRLKILSELSDALAYLHEKKFTHRDIKPHNIMLTGTLDVKLGDFGVTLPTKNKSTIFTPLYAGPETLDSKLISEKADVWALGIIIHQTFTPSLLYPAIPQESGLQYRHRMQKQLFGKPLDPTTAFKKEDTSLWDYYDLGKIFREAMTGCLHGDPSERWSAHSIREHLMSKREFLNIQIEDLRKKLASSSI